MTAKKIIYNMRLRGDLKSVAELTKIVYFYIIMYFFGFFGRNRSKGSFLVSGQRKKIFFKKKVDLKKVNWKLYKRLQGNLSL